MIRLNKIKQELGERYKADKSRFFVEASGGTLEEALNSAAIQLGVKVNFIDYEVMQKGKSGFFAIIPQEWKIIAYKNKKAENMEKAGVDIEEVEASVIEAIQDENIDGQAFICCFSSGVFLKVTAPQGNGSSVKINDVIEKFKKRTLPVPSESILMPIIKNANGKYKRVGDYKHNSVNDAVITVNISEDEMAAFIYVIPPGPGGSDVSAEQIEYFLKNNRVSHGFNHEKAIEFQDMPVYKMEYLVAEGISVKNGADAHMKYFFEIDTSNVNLQEGKGGQVDFRELNLIQNVVEGQPLAEKIPAQRGEAGMTVTGKYMSADNGKDIEIPLGENTVLSDDGLTVLSAINGHVSMVKRKITVEPIYVVEGNVSVKTGNIEFLGSVIVNGGVDDGYSVSASGNIEIKGYVGKCHLRAEGDIVIKQGVVGKEEGTIRCGKSLWAKFIQTAKLVEAGENIIVTDGIVNSYVMAKKKIICSGRRANIIGGVLSATEAIIARDIGSTTAGNDTVLSVGFDPKTKARVLELNKLLENNEKILNRVNLDLKVLEQQKKRIGAKIDQEVLNKNLTTKHTLEAENDNMKQELAKLKEALAAIKHEGRVSAAGNLYEGVTINIRDFTEIVKRDCTATTLKLDKGLIRYTKYQKEELEGA